MQNKQASFPATPANNYYFYLKKTTVSTIRSEHLVSLQLQATTWSQSLDFRYKTPSKLSLELKSSIIDKVEVHRHETCLVKWQLSPDTLRCPTAPRQLQALPTAQSLLACLDPRWRGPTKDPWRDRSSPPSPEQPYQKYCSGSVRSHANATARPRGGQGWWNRGFEQLPHFPQVSLHINIFRTTLLLLLVKIKKTKIDLNLLIIWWVNSLINFGEQGYIYSRTADRTLTMIRKQKTTTIH